jgi:hypothetical protein
MTVANNADLDYATLAARTVLEVQFELFVDLKDLLNPSLTETNRRVVIAYSPMLEPCGNRAASQPGSARKRGGAIHCKCHG